MSLETSQINELHWLMEMLHTIDVGLVVLDRDYKVQIWNGFMENHKTDPATTIIQDARLSKPSLLNFQKIYLGLDNFCSLVVLSRRYEKTQPLTRILCFWARKLASELTPIGTIWLQINF